jgi:hypothetical protein
MALTYRCCPLSYYYMAVAQDSPGYHSRSPTITEQPRGEQVSKLPNTYISTSRTQPNRNITNENTTREASLKDGTVTIRRPDRQAKRLVKSPDPSSLTVEGSITIRMKSKCWRITHIPNNTSLGENLK